MQKEHKIITIWLLTGCLLIAFMVIIGGITRLTHSGLSMVDWRPIMGTLPPLSESEWMDTFEKYKQSPEFKLVNYTFGLEDFKGIFWWEYIHRLLGRVIGIIFIVPFTFFLVKKWLDKKLLTQTLIILLLGGFQGVLGWIMVKSGLNKDPNVSHYKLAAHLITALTAYSYTFWVALGIIYRDKELKPLSGTKLKSQTVFLLVLAGIQIIYGAFVAGLKAGLHYNTFPKMNGYWVHPSISKGFEDMGMLSIFENLATVQFIHRYVAIILGILVIWVFIKNYSKQLLNIIKKGLVWLLVVTTLQVLLGVFTLVYHVPVALGVIHQFGALVLLTVLIHNLFIFRNLQS